MPWVGAGDLVPRGARVGLWDLLVLARGFEGLSVVVERHTPEALDVSVHLSRPRGGLLGLGEPPLPGGDRGGRARPADEGRQGGDAHAVRGSLTARDVVSSEPAVTLVNWDGVVYVPGRGGSEAVGDPGVEAQEDGQEADVPGGDQLVADDVPAVHGLGELGDGAGTPAAGEATVGDPVSGEGEGPGVSPSPGCP